MTTPLRYLPALALIFTWVLVLPGSTLPFQGGQALALVMWGLLAGMVLMGRRGGGRVSLRGGHAVVGMGLAALVISTLFSPAPRVALLGNDDRWLGSLAWGAALCLGVVAARWGLSPRGVACAGAVAAFYALGTLLWARLFPNMAEGWLAPLVPALQAGGTLGNGAFLGGALVPLLPLWGSLAWQEGRRGRWAAAWGWAGLTGGVLLALALTGARAVLVGVWVMGVFWGARMWRGRARVAWLAGNVLVPALAVAWAAMHPQSWAWDFLHRNGTLVQRLLVWQATLTLMGWHPGWALTGMGADTLGLFFPQVYPPALIGYEPDLQAHVFDRAHTFVLDVWVQFGVMGLAAWGALLLWAYFSWRRHRATLAEPLLAEAAWAGVFGLLAVWSLHFPTPATLVLAALLIPLAAGRHAAEAHTDWAPLLGVGLALVAATWLPFSPRGGSLWVAVCATLAGGWLAVRSHGAHWMAPLLLPTIFLGGVLLWPWETALAVSVAPFALGLAAWLKGEQGIRLSYGGVTVVLFLLVAWLLAPDVYLRQGEAALARGEVMTAIALGERAWYLSPGAPRERVALTVARFHAARLDASPRAALDAARAWLDAAPQPRSAAWWHVYLSLLDEGAARGLVSPAEVEAAYRAARAYFPGNVRW